MSKAPTIDMGVVTVTPVMAKTWLENNPINRPLRRKWALHLAEEMRGGRWHINGSTISFTKDGKLLDGQHRLTAIIESGKAVQMLVARNVDEYAFRSIDTGFRRSAAQIFGIDKIKNASASAAIARWIHNIEQGGVEHDRLSPFALMEVYEAHPLIEKYAMAQTHKGIKELMPSACLSVFVLSAEKYGPSVTDLFLYQFQTGEDMKRGSPVYELRERFIRQMGATAKLPARAKVAMTIKAVRAFVEDREIHQLRYAPDETFPSLY